MLRVFPAPHCPFTASKFGDAFPGRIVPLAGPIGAARKSPSSLIVNGRPLPGLFYVPLSPRDCPGTFARKYVTRFPHYPGILKDDGVFCELLRCWPDWLLLVGLWCGGCFEKLMVLTPAPVTTKLVSLLIFVH